MTERHINTCFFDDLALSWQYIKGINIPEFNPFVMVRGQNCDWKYGKDTGRSLTHSSLRRLVLEATSRDLHLLLFEATRGAVSIVRAWFFRSY